MSTRSTPQGYVSMEDLQSALSTAREEGRRDGLEEAAKVAESLPDQRGNSPEHLVGQRIAAAIRALKEKQG